MVQAPSISVLEVEDSAVEDSAGLGEEDMSLQEDLPQTHRVHNIASQDSGVR